MYPPGSPAQEKRNEIPLDFTPTLHGEHTCVVCTGTAYYINGAGEIQTSIQAGLGVKPRETAADGRRYLGFDLISSARWMLHPQGRTLEVTPTEWSRTLGNFVAGALGWDALCCNP